MSIKTTKSIKTVGLVGKPGDKEAGQVISGLCEFLRGRGLSIILEESTAAVIDRPNAPSRPLAQLGRDIDLAIVIGGDGTLLGVARNLARHGVPLVGVNVGRLGFLADISTDNMLQVIGDILDGDFQQEERFLLDAEIVREGVVAHRANAFNDVVVNKGELARLIELGMYIDGHFVSSTRADGIIVATPTGSTAYALSAGGPILHPTLPAIVLVPICPHTLSHRPLAVNSSAVIELDLVEGQSAYVTFDGQSFCSLQEGDRIRVWRAETPVTLIHPSNRNHYEVLRMKLHWGKHF